MRSRASILRLALAAGGVILVALFFALSGRIVRETRWTMLNVTPAKGQADCHLLELPNHIRVLIDAADAWDAEGEALRQLTALGIRSLDLVVISHFHRDHYGRLIDLINGGITVKRVAVNIPDREAADRERPWGCDYDDVMRTLQALDQRQIPWFVPKIGERLVETWDGRGDPVTLDAVCLYDGKNTPAGATDVNDTSIILKLSHGNTRALFTGDLNHTLGSWLANSTFDLSADLLKVPHHGTEGLAPDSFFDRVGPKAALIPAPYELWANARSLRVRNYMTKNKIPAFVSGIHGQVTVTMKSEGFSIRKELGL